MGFNQGPNAQPRSMPSPGDFSLCGMMPNQLSRTNQGKLSFLKQVVFMVKVFGLLRLTIGIIFESLVSVGLKFHKMLFRLYLPFPSSPWDRIGRSCYGYICSVFILLYHQWLQSFNVKALILKVLNLHTIVNGTFINPIHELFPVLEILGPSSSQVENKDPQ